MPKKEQTKTEILINESVLLGKEHVRFLEDLVERIDAEAGYRATKAQVIRLLVEGAMRRNYRFNNIKNETELRQALSGWLEGETTRVIRRS